MNVQTIFIAGGSGDLGKELAKGLAAQGMLLKASVGECLLPNGLIGANITIFARRQQPLDVARDEILAARACTSQEVRAVSLDLADAPQVMLPVIYFGSRWLMRKNRLKKYSALSPDLLMPCTVWPAAQVPRLDFLQILAPSTWNSVCGRTI